MAKVIWFYLSETKFLTHINILIFSILFGLYTHVSFRNSMYRGRLGRRMCVYAGFIQPNLEERGWKRMPRQTKWNIPRRNGTFREGPNRPVIAMIADEWMGERWTLHPLWSIQRQEKWGWGHWPHGISVPHGLGFIPTRIPPNSIPILPPIPRRKLEYLGHYLNDIIQDITLCFCSLL